MRFDFFNFMEHGPKKPKAPKAKKSPKMPKDPNKGHKRIYHPRHLMPGQGPNPFMQAVRGLLEKKHSKKWDSCVDKVGAKSTNVDPYAVCTSRLGKDSYEKKSKAGGPDPVNWFQACEDTLRGIRKCETDSATAFPAHQVPKKKKERRAVNFVVTKFKEAGKQPGELPTLFDVILIKEGMGNLHDAYFYTKEALESAAPIFEGKKCYADHPSELEEEIRPERSTRDILGHFEGLEVVQGEGGISELSAKLNILECRDTEWARACMERAIENSKKFPDTPFVGLSIHANGDADEENIDDVIKMAPDGAKPKLIDAKEQGIDTIRIVRKIYSATSCDLVTEAGAGGEILKSSSGGKTDGKKENSGSKRRGNQRKAKETSRSRRRRGRGNRV